jgi:hypothetical protein
MVPECKPDWNREAITVFSRLPSLRRLQATPLLQTSLNQGAPMFQDVDFECEIDDCRKYSSVKGQLISKCHFGVIIWTKIAAKILSRFLP